LAHINELLGIETPDEAYTDGEDNGVEVDEAAHQDPRLQARREAEAEFEPIREHLRAKGIEGQVDVTSMVGESAYNEKQREIAWVAISKQQRGQVLTPFETQVLQDYRISEATGFGLFVAGSTLGRIVGPALGRVSGLFTTEAATASATGARAVARGMTPAQSAAKASALGKMQAAKAAERSTLGRAIRADAIPAGSKLEYLGPGRVKFDGVEFRAVRDLGHLSELQIKEMKLTGKVPSDIFGNKLHGHHYKQQFHREPGAFVVEIPDPKHCISNPIQHPLGTSGGLKPHERADWNKIRVALNKERAQAELIRRGIQ
jgi:hypothetical protein